MTCLCRMVSVRRVMCVRRVGSLSFDLLWGGVVEASWGATLLGHGRRSLAQIESGRPSA